MRILLIKPNQPVLSTTVAPPLGLLYLVSVLRQHFGGALIVEVLDMKARGLSTDWLMQNLEKYAPDVVGLSVLNQEQRVSYEIADGIKKIAPETLTVIGGPFVHHRSREILLESKFDWAFEGEAERVFPIALQRHLDGGDLGQDLPGFSYKSGTELHICTYTDSIQDLDQLPYPAWDLVDFDLYKKLSNMNATLRGQKYATIFTSRGCPYKCNYCHDIFGKKFRWRSAENVLGEIELLYEHYGVDEFEIVDDIFNLHKPRLKKIMGEVTRRWPGRLQFCFPNGVRADILDESVLDALQEAGTYSLSIAIETVTTRLQELVEKHLDVDKAIKMIDEADKRGIMVRGFFMLGFPTESVEEMHRTIDMALRSRLTTAHFFCVTPQPETPLHRLAAQENPALIKKWDEQAGYYGGMPWYEAAYDYPLTRLVREANIRFYLTPKRIFRILRRAPAKNLMLGIRNFFSVVLNRPLIFPVVPPEQFGMSPEPEHRAAASTQVPQKVAA